MDTVKPTANTHRCSVCGGIFGPPGMSGGFPGFLGPCLHSESRGPFGPRLLPGQKQHIIFHPYIYGLPLFIEEPSNESQGTGMDLNN